MNESGLRVGHYRRILFCTDFSDNAKFAFDFAIDAAIRNVGCTLTLLHVIPEPDAQFWKTYINDVEGVNHKARRDIDAKIQKAYAARMPLDVRLDAAILIGADADEILKYAAKIQADLLVIGR